MAEHTKFCNPAKRLNSWFDYVARDQRLMISFRPISPYSGVKHGIAFPKHHKDQNTADLWPIHQQ